MNINKKIKIAVIGLGYAGLPLAVEFGKKYPTFGFDINKERINELKNGKDSTMEVSDDQLLISNELRFSIDVSEISDCNIFIITVPTLIDNYKNLIYNLLFRPVNLLVVF